MMNRPLPGTMLAVMILLTACTGHGQEAPIIPPGSAPDLLNESLVFFAGFDEARADADLAVGRGSPVRVDGSLRFVRGRFGSALVLGQGGGGVRVTYAAEGHLDFRRPGALSFWVKPLRWEPVSAASRGYVRFLSVLGHPGSFVIERMGFDRRLRRADRLIVGAFDLPGTKRLYVQIKGTESWNASPWHLIVLNWDRRGFEVSLDGGPFERREAPAGLSSQAFFDEGRLAPFVIGDRGPETSAIDELSCYAHPLDRKDAARLYGR